MLRKQGRRIWMYFALIVPTAALACNAIIGTRSDLTYDPDAAAGGDGGPANGADGNMILPGMDGGSGGDGATLDASDVDANPCGADLMNDKANCGACGFDCTTGVCLGGLCQLSDQQSVSMVIDGTNAYAAGVSGSAGYVYECATTGCTTTGAAFIYSNPSAWGARIRELNGQLYFANHYDSSLRGGVYSLTKAGDAGVITPPITGTVYDFAFGLDGGMLVYNIDDDGTGMNPVGVFACSTTSCVDAGPPIDSKVIAFDMTTVSNGEVAWASQNGVFTCASPVTCGTTKSRVFLPPAQPSQVPTAIGFDAVTQRIYFGITYAQGIDGDQIVSCGVAEKDCTPVVAQGTLDYPRDLLIDQGMMYWVEQGLAQNGVEYQGKVMKCALGADFKCVAPVVVALAQHAPSRLGIDAKAVYWSTEGKIVDYGDPGTLMKAPR